MLGWAPSTPPARALRLRGLCHLPAPSGAEGALREHPRQGEIRFVFSEDHRGLESVRSLADMGWEADPQVGGWQPEPRQPRREGMERREKGMDGDGLEHSLGGSANRTGER